MKKVLSLVLAVVLAFGMCTVAFAATNKIEYAGGVASYHIGSSSSGTAVSGNDSYDWSGSISKEFLEADEELKVYIDASNFNNLTGVLTTSKLSTGNITVKKKVSKGSDLINSIEFKNDGTTGVYVKIKLIDPFVSTAEKDLDFTIYLAHKGSKLSDTELNITGTMRNEEIEVDEGEDEVNLSEGAYAKAIAYIKSIKVDAGNGLYINTKFFEDKKYYAKAVQDVSAADDAILSQYPEIDTIYTLYSINMNSAGNTVEFDIDETYYVYNADGQYIGTTADKLPMSSKYYLATKKIDMGADVTEGDGDTTPVDVEQGDWGGDDVPANANDNPGTGANGFVNVAVVAGLVAIVAAGAVSRKK